MSVLEERPTMTRDGYEVARGVFTNDEIDGIRDAIAETIDRAARALRAPYELSHPDAPLEDRLERTAQKDRVYSLALYQAVLADAHRDPRVAMIETHARLNDAVRSAMAPYEPNGSTFRIRADIPTFPSKRRDWHQDVVHPSDQGCGSLRAAAWFPLHDVDEATGALEVLPGRWESMPHEKEGCGTSVLTEASVAGKIPRAIPMRRGDVLLMDRFLPHRGIQVTHGRCRWAVAMWTKGCLRA